MKKNKVYTKTGDRGMTSLVGGQRVEKTDIRLEAYGTVDELNAYLGLLITQLDTKKEINLIREIQNQLFTLGSYLATDCSTSPTVQVQEIKKGMVERLEKIIDEMNLELPLLEAFVLPGGTIAASTCHICRTICRRAERRILTLHKLAPLTHESISYINRLSDFLFVLSRKINFLAQKEEIFWDKTCE